MRIGAGLCCGPQQMPVSVEASMAGYWRTIVSAVAGAVLFVLPALADEQVNKDGDDIAIKGYDPVAYFTQGKPTPGTADFQHRWQNATWRFSSAEHRELFASAPDKYAPRYGGFCAGAMALGWKAPIDPEAWVIVDGKLYLNYDKDGRDDFASDPKPQIAKADANWERIGR
jgi:hypothetical protein